MKSFLPHERAESLRHRINRIIAKILRKEVFWDYDLDGAGYDGLEYPSLDAARTSAEESYADYCEEQGGYQNGDVTDVECEFMQYFYNRNGDPCVMRLVTETIEYEYYHGDYAEHFSQRDYI